MKGSGEGSGGEIVQVDGGLILRSTSRKDRHSKVYTSKGPRDRRVRLSAHTAIQFYDVQDRLGYDRPSKAVDWLIKKAKAAIDKLCERDCDSNPRVHQSESHSGFASSTFLVDQPQPDAHLVNTMRSLVNTSFPGFSSDGSVSRESFQCEDHLGLSLQTFQGSFVEMGMGNSDYGTVPFGNRELLQSNIAVNPSSQRLLSYSDHHNTQPCCSKPWDFGTPFDLGFPVQAATIYGEEEADNPSSFKC